MRAFALTLMLLWQSSSARANLEFEPVLGKGLSGAFESSTRDGLGTREFSLLTYGVRAAFNRFGISIGCEYRVGNGGVDGSASGAQDASFNSFAFFVSYEGAVGRFYGAVAPTRNLYFFETVGVTKLTGRAYFAGYSFRVLDNLALGFEIHRAQFSEVDQLGFTSSLSSTSSTMYMINLSMPFFIPLYF